MTPDGMITIRYTGDHRRSEVRVTGRGKEWWPGELRTVPMARGLQLLAAGQGWERDDDEDDVVAITPAQNAAGAVGLAVQDSQGRLLGADGSPVSRGLADPRTLYAGSALRLHLYGNSHIETGYNWLAAAAASNGRMSIVKNSGVSGYKTEQVLAKLQAEGISSTANCMYVSEGTNDAKASVTVAAHIANMREIVLYAVSRGVPVIIGVCPPTDSTYQSITHTYYHAEIELAKQLSVPWIDPWATVTDTDGTLTAGTADATLEHVSVGPQWGMGAYLMDWLGGTRQSMLLPRSQSAPGLVNTTANQLCLTDTNADGMPDGWSVLTMTGYTINARTDAAFPYRGKLNSISISQTGASYLHRPGYTTGWAVGETVRISGFLAIESSTNLRLDVIVRCQGSVSTVPIAITYFGDTALHYFENSVVIAGTGLTDLQIQLKASNAVGSIAAYSGTVKWGGVHLYNVTRNQFG